MHFKRQTMTSALFLSIVLAGASLAGADQRASVLRSPQYPLKTRRAIFTDQDLEAVRKNAGRYPRAQAIVDQIVRLASEWLERPDDELLRLIVSAKVPRAFNVGTAGCPKCGKAIYEKGGTYPWRLDLARPFQVECPICEGRFPGNDFAAYYQSGFQEETYLEGPFSDDGWGWEDPNGRRYWFVAYANHWNWQNRILPAIRNLARAYLLTGDRRYAHKSAIMLTRVAQFYPAMDYHEQSRYGRLQQDRGVRYEGKTLNAIWETNVLHMLAESYDAVWETIDKDRALQKLIGMAGEEIRAHIEANLLEGGIEAVHAKKISGNYGMHQRALIYAALARGGGPVDRWLDGVMKQTGPDIRHLGLDYALYNLVYRDGIPYETSPGYNFSWVRNITEIAETLARADRDVYVHPKMRRLYDGVLDVVQIGRHTPSLGDSGNVHGGLVGRDAYTFQAAYRAYGDRRMLRHLEQFGATGETGFTTYETLFKPIIQAAAEDRVPPASRLLDGYGMGILNNRSNTVSLSLYYGTRGGHGHFDRLHFDLFACGQPMTPDLGYPDFMNAYVPGIYTWSKNTISHNTVTVGESRQQENIAGTVRLMADSPFARVIDVSAPETYSDCRIYDRRMLMVDVDAGRSYCIDLFTVVGGDQHDYSLHGPPGTFEIIGGNWSEPAAGTLAGPEVAVGEMYDNRAMSAEGYSGSYAGYRGSGFQHLTHVQRHRGGGWIAQWQHEKDPRARLRIRLLDQPGQEMILATAQVSPVKHKRLIHYVIARRRGRNLRSRFVGILEPYSEEPFIEDVQILPADAIGAVTDIEGARREMPSHGRLQIEVTREEGWRDRILFDGLDFTGPRDPGKGHESLEGPATSRSVSVETFAPDGELARRFAAGPAAEALGGMGLRGEVIRVDPPGNIIRIRPTTRVTPDVAAALEGRVVHFRGGFRQTSHPIRSAKIEGEDLLLETRDALMVGRAHMTSVSPQMITTDARFHFPSVYRGAHLTDGNFIGYYQIDKARSDSITLDRPLPGEHRLKVGQDGWVVNVGPGDAMFVPPLFVWEK